MTLSIVAPSDGDLLDPTWAEDVTDAVNGGMTGVSGDFAVGGNFTVSGRTYGKIIGRAERTTSSSTTTTTEIGVLQLDDIPLISGRSYLIASSALILDSSVNSDVMAARYRATVDGTTPTVASTLFGGITITGTTSSGQASLPLLRFYHPSSNETLSLWLTIIRLAGTGNVNITAATGFPIDILVIDLDVGASDTGVDL